MRRTIAILSVLLATMPALGQTVPADTPNITTVTRLANGVRVVHCQENETDLAAISVFIRRTPGEEGKTPGIGPFVIRAIFGDNLNQSRERVMASVDAVGGVMETTWTRDFLVINCVTGAANLEDAFWLVAQAMTTAEFDAQTVSRARNEVADAARVQASEPLSVAEMAVRSAVHGDSPYRVPDADTTFTNMLDRASALRYTARAFNGPSTVISIRGNVGLARTTDLVSRKLAEYPDGPTSEMPVDHPAFDPTTATKLIPGATTTAVAIGMEAPSVTSADYPAFAVLATIVGGGKSSRVCRAIRDSAGIGYEIGVTAPLTALTGDWMASVEYDATASGAPSPNDVATRLKGVLQEVLDNPPTQAEVDRAKRFTAGRHALAHQRLRDRCYLSGLYEALGTGAHMDETFGAMVERVTRTQVLAAAQRYLRQTVTVIVKPSPQRTSAPAPATN